MSRILGVVFIYSAMFLGWTSISLFMMLAPARFGNLIHDSFGILPSVERSDWGKKLVIRLAGLGLLGFAVRFAIGIAALARQFG